MLIEWNVLELRFDSRSNARLPVANSVAGMCYWAFWLIAGEAQATAVQGELAADSTFFVPPSIAPCSAPSPIHAGTTSGCVNTSRAELENHVPGRGWRSNALPP
jgi:hypothetical protein